MPDSQLHDGHALTPLRERLAEVFDLNRAAAVLEWDQETYMPPGGAEARAHQVATLRRLAHERLTDDAVGSLLDAAGLETKGLDEDDYDRALVRVTRRDFARATLLPSALVAALAEAKGHAVDAWRAARATNDSALFAPHLQRLLNLNREQAERLLPLLEQEGTTG